RQVMPGGNTRTTLFIPPHPPYASRGAGFEVTDVDGHRLIDLHANYTSLVHGHAHPAVVAAAVDAVSDGTCFGLPTEPEIELAETLCERVRSVDWIRFTNSGTEAVMMAIRAARAFTGRPGVLRFAGAYHGTADAVASDTSPGVPEGTSADVHVVPFDDEQAFVAALAERGDELACVLLDLMPNRTGLRQASPAFAARVRAETARRGILLVVDEVITFRLSHGGLQERYSLSPDLVTFGKIVGGGFPIGAFGGRADVMGVFDPSRPTSVPHGGTFSANPVAMRAGRAALSLLDESEIERINALGDRLRAELVALPLEVVGRGSLLGITAVRDEPRLWWRLYEAGLLVAPIGLATVSTAMDEPVVDEIVERFAVALREPGR
ncbi:MAG: aminotransferase class III-fold pyridoxal phosphate-dependent enzyme, partial [Actinomycetota bacterium]|nr:aminotransferase class III-fold pyridoxal phosphate-dependent enzyme [Actinomycetota bacterium]